MILGGVLVDFAKGPESHSDGDAVLHAVIDALLGASGKGDIGEWFPDSDPKYKDANSAKLLEQVKKEIDAAWAVVNVDVNIILEEPKLGPIKGRIRANIAKLLGINFSQVNVKAKSMEGLGDVGEGRALIAQAVVELKAR